MTVIIIILEITEVTQWIAITGIIDLHAKDIIMSMIEGAIIIT